MSVLSFLMRNVAPPPDSNPGDAKTEQDECPGCRNGYGRAHGIQRRNFALAQAMTTSQTSFGENASEADFFNTLTWGGIAWVTIGGNAFDDFTIDSASGVDWRVAAFTAISAPRYGRFWVLPCSD